MLTPRASTMLRMMQLIVIPTGDLKAAVRFRTVPCYPGRTKFMIRKQHGLAINLPLLNVLFDPGGRPLKTLGQDLRYAFRQLSNAPAFTLTAVLTLALGIGANTAVFTLVHEVLLKSLPVANPSGLYRLGDKYECCIEGGLQKEWTMFSYPLYQYLRDNTPEYEMLAASQTSRPDLSVR